MITICITNAKGGVGKTTSAITFGAILAEKGKKILVVDMDQQGNTSNLFAGGKQAVPRFQTIRELLLAEEDITFEDVVIASHIENVDLLPSNNRMKGVDHLLLTMRPMDANKRLKKILSNVRDAYDYCLIDCPPALGTVTLNALTASDELLVPLAADQYTMDGLEDLLKDIREVKEELNPNLRLKACFLVKDSSTLVINREMRKRLKSILGDAFLEQSIRQNVAVSEATVANMPVTEYDEKCHASLDYKKLAEVVFR